MTLTECLKLVIFFSIFTEVFSKFESDLNSSNVITTSTLAIWKNATVPFYVNSAHFDHEQTLAILSALSTFAFKTCLKFKPVMARPEPDDEVLVFINPEGSKRCTFSTRGHSVFNPHIVKLGYECLKPPHVDMMIMRALGLPFEHNRDTRDLHIQVLQENIESGNIELFTKEDALPLEMRFLPYDVNSVMHFGNRDFSKNGHRTILFKDPTVKQNRVSLTDIDLKKLEIVYGPECRVRDRLEKIELCQSYPGVARKKRQLDDNVLDDTIPTKEPTVRKKRDIDSEMVSRSLRVNPDITPPPMNHSEDVTQSLKELGIDEAVQEIIEQVHKVSSLALKNARVKYCNETEVKLHIEANAAREGDDVKVKSSSDILGIIGVVADFAKNMVDNAIQNLTEFCENSEGLEVYQRFSCNSFSKSDPRCRHSYKSTHSGAVKHWTQHRPLMSFSTNHDGAYKPARQYERSGNTTEDGEEATTVSIRIKRDLETTTEKPVNNDKPKATTVEKDAVVNEAKQDKQENESIPEIKVHDSKEKADKENKNTTAENRKESVLISEPKTVSNHRDKMRVNNKDPLRISEANVTERSPNHRKSRGDDREHFADDQHTRDVKLAKRIVKKKQAIQKSNRKKDHGTERHDRNFEAAHRIKDRRHKKHKHKHHDVIPASAYVKDDGIDDQEVDFGSDKESPNVREEEPRQNKARKLKEKKTRPHQTDEDVESDVEEERRPKKKLHQSEENGLPPTVPLSKENQEFYNERRWPDGELVFMIQEDTTYDLADMRSRLDEVKDILQMTTCVKMIEIRPNEADNYEDYLVIDNSPDYVTGRVGGKQNFGSIELFRGGQHRQHAAMMVMAMLGFYFEVSRHDRDRHIRVHMRHVRPDKLHHFEKIRSDATLAVPYDYASATHPAWQFWRQLGRTGISTVATYKEKDPDGKVMKSLGQNKRILSDTDIVKINSVYGVECFKHSKQETSNFRQNEEPMNVLQKLRIKEN